ncbi:hypothetical protein B484DRAFT_412047, partial [Ochromonadaceae sp. CCMP2298]
MQHYLIPYAPAVLKDESPGATAPRVSSVGGVDNAPRAVLKDESPGTTAPTGAEGRSATRVLPIHSSAKVAGRVQNDGEADMGSRVVELEDDLPSQPNLDPPAHTPAEPNEDYDENEAFIPLELLCTLEQLQQRISVLFPQSARRWRAYRRVAYHYNMLAAIEAAMARDAEEFAAAGEDLDLMCALRIVARHTARLNPSRVQQCISTDNPQRELLLEFATKGVD